MHFFFYQNIILKSIIVKCLILSDEQDSFGGFQRIRRRRRAIRSMLLIVSFDADMPCAYILVSRCVYLMKVATGYARNWEIAPSDYVGTYIRTLQIGCSAHWQGNRRRVLAKSACAVAWRSLRIQWLCCMAVLHCLHALFAWHLVYSYSYLLFHI